MKAEIKKDGCIHIVAETITEAFALKYVNLKAVRDNDNGIGHKVVLDCGILNQQENEL